MKPMAGLANKRWAALWSLDSNPGGPIGSARLRLVAFIWIAFTLASLKLVSVALAMAGFDTPLGIPAGFPGDLLFEGLMAFLYLQTGKYLYLLAAILVQFLFLAGVGTMVSGALLADEALSWSRHLVPAVLYSTCALWLWYVVPADPSRASQEPQEAQA